MSSKRRHEGWVYFENPNQAPLPDEVELRALVRPGLDILVPPSRKVKIWELAFVTCSHRQETVKIHPLRVRDRAYCRLCDHYICDRCDLLRNIPVSAGGDPVHMPMLQRLDNALTLAHRMLA